MASKKEKQILSKIKILLTQQFENPQEAFEFFDKNEDGNLSRSEVKELLKQAKVSKFIRGVVSTKLIEKFDESSDERIEWPEFKQAVKDIT